MVRLVWLVPVLSGMIWLVLRLSRVFGLAGQCWFELDVELAVMAGIGSAVSVIRLSWMALVWSGHWPACGRCS